MDKLSKRIYGAVRYLFLGKPTTYLTTSVSYTSASGKLSGRKVVITGGGHGLGFAMARRFRSEGAEVLIAGRSEARLKEAAEQLGCQYLLLDVQDVASFDTFIKGAEVLLGGVDSLVNNAGVSLHEGAMLNVSTEQYDAQFDTNLRGAYFLTQRFLKLMVENKRKGSILFVSSERGSTTDELPYGLTKIALNSLVRGLAYRYIHHGIRVNAVAPGITSSSMTGYTEEGNQYCEWNINGRIYRPDEVAEVAAFLLSDAAGCLNGQILECNEGKNANIPQ